MRTRRIAARAVTLHSAAGTLGAPSTGTDGADVTGMRQGGHGPQLVALDIDAAGSLTMSDAYLCGYDGSDWRIIAKLNNGDDIALTATLGWAEKFADVGTYDRLAVYATLSASTVTVTATPIEVL